MLGDEIKFQSSHDQVFLHVNLRFLLKDEGKLFIICIKDKIHGLEDMCSCVCLYQLYLAKLRSVMEESTLYW